MEELTYYSSKAPVVFLYGLALEVEPQGSIRDLQKHLPIRQVGCVPLGHEFVHGFLMEQTGKIPKNTY